MYNFEDKRGIAAVRTTYTQTYIYNKNYIPFSILINLNPNDNYFNGSTISTRLKQYEYGKKTSEIKLLEERLKQWIEDYPCVITTYRSTNGRELISKFYETITGDLYFRDTHIRNTRNYTRGYYTLFEKDLSKFYFTLMVKREYIKYIKLCILLNEPILEDCFEFWYDEGLILEENDLKVKRVTNKIIKELNSMDIPCINKDNILNLLQPEIKFNAPTISKQKELISEFVEAFQKFELNKTVPF